MTSLLHVCVGTVSMKGESAVCSQSVMYQMDSLHACY